MLPLKTIQTYVLIVVATLIITIISFLYITNKHLKSELETTKTQLVEALDANNNLSNSINNQNKAITILENEASKNKLLHEEELKKAKEKAKELKNDATRILNIKVPKNEDSCKNISKIIKQEVFK